MFLIFFFFLNRPILFCLVCFDDGSWCCCALMQACVYASCVSIGRHQSSGFVLQGAGLQMRDRQDMRAENRVRFVLCHEQESSQHLKTKQAATEFAFISY